MQIQQQYVQHEIICKLFIFAMYDQMKNNIINKLL